MKTSELDRQYPLGTSAVASPFSVRQSSSSVVRSARLQRVAVA